MKNITRLLVVFGLLSVAMFAQTALTQTTLSGAVNGPVMYSGSSTPTLSTTVTLTSVTGVVAAFNTSVIQSVLYVGQEAMGVVSVNSSTLQVNVLRGYLGTKASPHPSGDMVLIGQFNLLGSNMFFQQDPPFNGACISTAIPSTPWVNVMTGAQWLCSSVTGTWVPGWNNPLNGGAEKVTAAVASAAGLVTPSGPLFHITGTAAITGFNIPVGFDATPSGGGSFCAIPDGIFTTTAASNIALASTAVVNKMLCWQWDATNSKFVPTY
jgi:hypothetical protein